MCGRDQQERDRVSLGLGWSKSKLMHKEEHNGLECTGPGSNWQAGHACTSTADSEPKARASARTHLGVCKAHDQGHDGSRQALVMQVGDGLRCLIDRRHAHQRASPGAAVGAGSAAVQHAALDDRTIGAEQRAQLLFCQVLGQVLGAQERAQERREKQRGVPSASWQWEA